MTAPAFPRAATGPLAPPRVDDPPSLRFQRLLVAYDGSPGSVLALRWAQALAAPGPARVLLLLGQPALAGARPDLPAALRRMARAGVRAETLVVAGAPAEEILRASLKSRADLVLAGASGHGGARRLVVGSVSDALLRRATTSVLLARTAPPPRRILCGHDGSPEGHEAALAALDLARHLLAPVDFVQVDAGLPDDGRGTPYPANAVPDDLQGLIPGAERAAHTFGLLGGSPGRALVRAARGTHAGLVVVGRRGRGHAPLLGRVSAHVAHHAPASVLVVRRKDGADGTR